jgi:hypothetical protein
MNRWICFIAALAALAAPVAAGAQGMPHEELSFDCSRCHQNADDRSDIGFDHSELEFELTGHHEVVGCKRCHDLADFARADDRCATCHTDVHQGQLDPECETCHSPDGWDVIDAYGAHSQTAFQLLGAHIRLDCDACHQREIIAERARLFSDCVDCHLADYEANESPDHAYYGFPTTCDECHNQLSFYPATMNYHPGDFPIFSGTHAGEWNSCSDCHVEQGNFDDFSCFGCHKHNEADMAEEHEDVSYYYYDSYACYGCHPTGTAPEDD